MLKPNNFKGVDDFIAAEGEESFHKVYQNARSLEVWKAKILNDLLLSLSPASSSFSFLFLP